MIKNVKKIILDFFEENGTYININDETDDIDLREYLIDSLQYIYFLVELERMLEVELPDDILFYENLSSLNGFSNHIQALLLDDIHRS